MTHDCSQDPHRRGHAEALIELQTKLSIPRTGASSLPSVSGYFPDREWSQSDLNEVGVLWAQRDEAHDDFGIVVGKGLH